MSRRGIQMLIGMLATEEDFKEKFFEDPERAIDDSGCDIDGFEKEKIIRDFMKKKEIPVLEKRKNPFWWFWWF